MASEEASWCQESQEERQNTFFGSVVVTLTNEDLDVFIHRKTYGEQILA